MKISFVSPYPKGQAPSQRFRFEQYLDLLKNEGHEVELLSFLGPRSWNKFYQKGKFFRKFLGLVKGTLKRVVHLIRLSNSHFVVIHREAAPLGPPVFEWIIAKVLRKKIIFDFDDAIWLNNSSDNNKWFAWLKQHNNFKKNCKWAYKVSAGNEFLAAEAAKYNRQVVINPTTIDELVHNASMKTTNDIPVIGWTGSHSTVKYLESIVPILRKLREKNNFIVKIISDSAPEYDDDFIQFIKWNKTVEIQELGTFDIGLMPLTNDKWTQGKCGFKALQYLSMGIPAVVSDVGVNSKIVQNGTTGFLCNGEQDWFNSLQELLSNSDKRKKMGQDGKSFVLNHYSVQSNSSNFLLLFT